MPVKDASDALVHALSSGFGVAPLRFERVHARPWASAAFKGVRHVVTLNVGGNDADGAAEAFARGLSEREFDLGPHLLADIRLAKKERSPDGMRLTLEALTIAAD